MEPIQLLPHPGLEAAAAKKITSFPNISIHSDSLLFISGNFSEENAADYYFRSSFKWQNQGSQKDSKFSD